jgi:hypothetical protein
VDQIVDHDDILQPSVLYNSEILDEEAVLSLHAVFAVQKSLDGLFGLVEVGDDGLCVVEGACGEDVDVVVLTHVGQKLEAVGPHVEAELVAVVVVGHVGFLVFVEDGVDQGFV